MDVVCPSRVEADDAGGAHGASWSLRLTTMPERAPDAARSAVNDGSGLRRELCERYALAYSTTRSVESRRVGRGPPRGALRQVFGFAPLCRCSY